MPKQKTHKGAAKRFKMSAGGKVMRRRSMHSHILTKKTTARKRRLRGEVAVSRAAQRLLQQLLHK